MNSKQNCYRRSLKEISYLFFSVLIVFNVGLYQLESADSSRRLQISAEICCALERDPCPSVFLPEKKCNFWI